MMMMMMTMTLTVGWVLKSCSVQSLDRLGRRGNMMDDSAEILFQSVSAGGHRELF